MCCGLGNHHVLRSVRERNTTSPLRRAEIADTATVSNLHIVQIWQKPAASVIMALRVTLSMAPAGSRYVLLMSRDAVNDFVVLVKR